MRKERYNIHDLEGRYKWLQKPLPEDVNRPVEDIMCHFNNDDLNRAIREVREKKLYGSIYFYLNQFLIAEIPFKYGMCPRYELYEPLCLTYGELKDRIRKGGAEVAEFVTFKRSIYNDNLTSFKPKYNKEQPHGPESRSVSQPGDEPVRADKGAVHGAGPAEGGNRTAEAAPKAA